MTPSLVFWQRAPEEDGGSLFEQALKESWYPDLSLARVKYLVSQLQRRFPAPGRARLKGWGKARKHAPILCHWHLQLTDPLYRDFTFGCLVPRWTTGHEELELDEVESWLSRRVGAERWQGKTRRRLASGLFSAATEAGLLEVVDRTTRASRKPKVEAEAVQYLLSSLDKTVDKTPYLLTAGWGELEVEQARREGSL